MSARGMMLAALVLLAPPAAGAQERVNERVRTGGTGEVQIHLPSGEVRVVGWDRGEIQVTGDVRGSGSRVVLSRQGGRDVVRVAAGRRGGADLEVRVPSRKDVTVHTGNGDVHVSGIGGAVEAHSGNGTVVVEGRPREVEVATGNGDVALEVVSDRVSVATQNGDVEVGGTVRREVEVATVSGTVQVSASVPEARVETMSGDIALDDIGGRAEVGTVSGSVRVQGRRLRGSVRSVSGDLVLSGDLDGSGSLQLNTHNGDVTLRLGRRTGAEVEVSTLSGDVDNDVENSRVVRASGRERLIRVGRGGARVAIRTFSGDVTLEGN